MSALDWFLGLKLSYKLGVGVFFFTIIVYGLFFLLGKKWRREYEAQGVSYWRTSKEERMAELMVEVWEPRKIIILYTLSYFSNGFVRTTFNLWVPVYLLDVAGINTIEASLFVGLMYITWSWKMFLGLIADIFPIPWGVDHTSECLGS